jgi:hypothetical protein
MLWKIYWIAIWGFCGFFIPEMIALHSPKRGDTLSETVWNLFRSTGPANPADWPFARYMLLVFMIWLTVHFCWAIWR